MRSITMLAFAALAGSTQAQPVIDVIVAAGQPVPNDLLGRTVTSIDGVRINGAGGCAALVRLSDNADAVWGAADADEDASHRLIEGDTLNGRVIITLSGIPSLLPTGQLAGTARATRVSDGGFEEGLYLDGQPVLLIGDPVPGRPGTSYGRPREAAFSDDGTSWVATGEIDPPAIPGARGNAVVVNGQVSVTDDFSGGTISTSEGIRSFFDTPDGLDISTDGSRTAAHVRFNEATTIDQYPLFEGDVVAFPGVDPATGPFLVEGETCPSGIGATPSELVGRPFALAANSAGRSLVLTSTQLFVDGYLILGDNVFLDDISVPGSANLPVTSFVTADRNEQDDIALVGSNDQLSTVYDFAFINASLVFQTFAGDDPTAASLPLDLDGDGIPEPRAVPTDILSIAISDRLPSGDVALVSMILIDTLATATTGDDTRAVVRFILPPAGPCSTADIAPMIGRLGFLDALAHVNAFANADPSADTDASGTLDFFDTLRFLRDFDAGCP